MRDYAMLALLLLLLLCRAEHNRRKACRLRMQGHCVHGFGQNYAGLRCCQQPTIDLFKDRCVVFEPH
eukprot:9133009-Lingulodinium_polyedra.AAC.1